MAASSAHAVLAAAEEIRQELARLAKAMPGSPLADADVADVDPCRRQRSPATATTAARSRSPMRCDTASSSGSRRRSSTSSRRTRTHARNTHSAVFAEVKVDERAWRHPRHASRERRRGRADLEHQDWPQPDHGQRGLGNRDGPARGDGDGSPLRPDHEREHRRVPYPGECRRSRHRRDLRRRAATIASTGSASRDWARSASSASPRRSRTPSITPPASASAASRSRWTSCLA